MKKLFLITAALLLLQGCSASSSDESKIATAGLHNNYLYYYIAHSFSGAGLISEESDDKRENSGSQTESDGYGTFYQFNGEKSLILSEVVSKMAEQLLFNLPPEYYNESIALTSIVDLRDHKVTNWLGQTIAEQFFHELHIRKLSVIDFKLTGDIQLTPEGEFALTRDWKKLSKQVDVQRILTGTMSRNEEGVIINVRIVNVNSNRVESTSSAFIPKSIFAGREYDYQDKKYLSRNSDLIQKGHTQVHSVK